MNEQEARQLLEKYLNDQSTDEERIIVHLWLEQEMQMDSWEMDDTARTLLGAAIRQRIEILLANEDVSDARLASDGPGARPSSTGRPASGAHLQKMGSFPLRRLTAAAAVILIATAAVYLLSSRDSRQGDSVPPAPIIRPGGNRAMLLLADGSHIALTDAKEGSLATQGATRVVKPGDGRLVYLARQDDENDTSKYNTVSTPRGGQYQVTLSDGSRVWLNAASSITFPARFGRSGRHVSVRGEAYFEVSPDSRRPFSVSYSGQSVEVLGTSFDIKDYGDEPGTSATLIEGRVRVRSNSKAVTIGPGEAAITDKDGGALNVQTADGKKETAWTRGEFVFVNENIGSVMRQISRWYDVDVSYEGVMTGKDFSGSISRFSEVDKVLNTLQLTGIIHFKIQGRRIMVTTR